MARTVAERRGASIARPIFLLVIISVLVATAISFVVTFSGPPPFDFPKSLRLIAVTLKGEIPPMFDRGPPPGDHRPGPGPLRRQSERAAPVARSGETADAAARLRLAAELAANPADVLAFTETASDTPRDAFVGSYTFAWREGGRWWVVRSHVRPFLTRWHVRTLLAMLAAILLLSIPAWLIVRALTRPLRLARSGAMSRAPR